MPPFDPSVWNRYSGDEAILLRARFGPRAGTAREWEVARRSAAALRLRHGTSSPFAIGALEKIPILFAEWQTNAAGLLFLGECSLDPRRIRINATAVRLVSAFAQKHAEGAYRDWFDERRIMDCIAAHELFHVLCRCTGGLAAEARAHAFARELLGLSYSTLAYEHAARLAMSERDRRTHASAMPGMENEALPGKIHRAWREWP